MSIIAGAAIYQSVINNSDPEVNAAVSPQIAVAELGETLSFDASGSTGDIVEFIWSFPDGTTQNSPFKNPIMEYTFTQTGLFTISLITVSRFGLTSLTTSQVRVQNTPPVAKMDVPALLFEDQLEVFSAEDSTDSVFDIDSLTYYWDLGDGNTQEGKSITHAYSKSGTYYVTLLVQDAHGAFDYKYQKIVVQNQIPQAVAEVNATNIQEDSAINFDASQSSDSQSDLDTMKYLWSFGDGTTSSLESPNHIYLAEGIYQVELSVKDDDGEISSVTFEISVDNVKPNLRNLPANVEITEGQTYIFRAEAADTTTDFNQLDYQWNSGQNGSNLALNFLDEGTQILTSTVIDDNDAQDSTQSQINVLNAPPIVNFVGATTTANISIYSLGTITENITYYLTRDGEKVMEFDLEEKKPYLHKNETPYYEFDLSSNWAFNITYSPTELNIFQFAVVIVVLRSTLGVVVRPLLIIGALPQTWNSSTIINQELYGFPIKLKNIVNDPGQDDITLTWYGESNPLSNVTKFVESTVGQSTSFSYDASIILLPSGFTTIAEFVNFYLENGFFNMTLLVAWVLLPEVMDLVAELELFLQGVMNEILSRIDTEIVFFISRSEDTDTNIHLQANDHDGGIDETVITLMDVDGRINPLLAPNMEIIISDLNLLEDQTVELGVLMVNVDPSLFDFEWSFGDGNTAIGQFAQYTYSYEGSYLISMTATKGNIVVRNFVFITVENVRPNARVSVNQMVYEDEIISLQASGTIDTASDLDSLRYIWDFGDGTISTGGQVDHIYQLRGVYEITLMIVDDNGAVDIWTGTVTVKNRKPTLAMNTGYSIKEGNTLLLTPTAQDSSSDLFGLNYEWILNEDQSFTTDTLSLILDDGSYQIKLIVFDNDGENDTILLTISVENQLPVIYVPNFDFQGPINENIALQAMFYDSPNDIENLKYTWILDSLNSKVILAENKVTSGNVLVGAEFSISSRSNLDFLMSVQVTDNADTSDYDAFLSTFVDSDGDFWSDFEEIYFRGTSPTSPDTDGDFIIDSLEEEQGTLPTLSDSDGDKLWDGYNPADGFGELTLGTDPSNPDTDGDFLDDGIEVFGWEITIVVDGSNKKIHVTSNPFLKDSDTDGLSDKEEFDAGTNPLKQDTDQDGIKDGDEADEGTDPLNPDTDGDNVPDGEELIPYRITWQGIYRTFTEYPVSNPTLIDSDNDGLSDYEERNEGEDGAITNAEREDTDRDGLTDKSEQYEKRFAVSDRYKIIKSPIPIPIFNTKIITTRVFGQIKKAEFVIATNGGSANGLKITLSRFGVQTLVFRPESTDIFFMEAFDFTSIAASGTQIWTLIIEHKGSGDVFVQEAALIFTIATSVVDADNDDDLLSDGEEINFGRYGWTSDPNNPDSDSDGLGDGDEVINKNLNPLLWDTDGDGFTDGVDNYVKNNAMLKVTLISIEARQNIDGFGEGEDDAELFAIFNLNSDISELYYVTKTKSVGTGSTVPYNSAYYFDVDDTVGELEVHVQIWDRDNLSDDDKHMDVWLGYDMRSNALEWKFSNNLIEMVLLFETILQPRVQTILINASSVTETINGDLRYNGDEQFYLIYAKVYNPFPFSSLYTILVPRSVFAISKLNSTIVDGVSSDLPDFLKNFEFYEDDFSGGTTEKLVSGIMSGVVFQFFKGEYDDLIDLLTTNSTGQTFANAVSVQNDLLSLGLDPVIVNLVPVQGFSNSATGSPPKSLVDKLGDLVGSVVNVVVTVVDFVVTGIVAVGNFLIQVVEVAIEVGKSLLGVIGEVYEAVQEIVEILIDIIEMIMNFVIDLISTVVRLAVDSLMILFQDLMDKFIEDVQRVLQNEIATNALSNLGIDILQPQLPLSIDSADALAELLFVMQLFSFVGTIGISFIVIAVAVRLAEAKAIIETGGTAPILAFIKKFVVGFAYALLFSFAFATILKIGLALFYPDFEGSSRQILGLSGDDADFVISASIGITSVFVGYAFIVRTEVITIEKLGAIAEFAFALMGMFLFTFRTLIVMRADKEKDQELEFYLRFGAFLLSLASVLSGLLATKIGVELKGKSAGGLVTQYIIIQQALNAFAILSLAEGIAGVFSDIISVAQVGFP